MDKFIRSLNNRAQELKPKVETNTSFLVPRPFLGVDSVKTASQRGGWVPETSRARLFKERINLSIG